MRQPKCHQRGFPSSAVVCWAVALATVVAVVLFVPRQFHANDDVMIVEFLRTGTSAPFIAPLLSSGLGALYRTWSGVPWYGLYLYALYALTLGSGLGSLRSICRLPGERWARAFVQLSAVVLAALLALLVVQPTFTIVGISSSATALIGFVVELESAHQQRRRISRARALFLGLLLMLGTLTRGEALVAACVSTGPLLAWFAVRLMRRRQAVATLALVALLGPLAITALTSPLLVRRQGAQTQRFNRFNGARGKIHGSARFATLHQRAPELLKRVGWTNKRFVQFERWLYLDEGWFTVERVEALAATGGVAPQASDALSENAVRGVWRASLGGGDAMVLLLALGFSLLLLGYWQIAAFALSAACGLAAAALAIRVLVRFPPRIALPIFLYSAFALLVLTAIEVSHRPRSERPRFARLRRGLAAALLIACCARALAAGASELVQRNASPTGLIERLRQRAPNAVIISYAMAGLRRDPLSLRAAPLPLIALGWGIFSPPFYRGLSALGITRAAELWSAARGSDQAFLILALRYAGKMNKVLGHYGAALELLDLEEPNGTYRVIAIEPSLAN